MKKTFLSVVTGLCLTFTALAAQAGDAPLPKFDKAHTAVVITDPQKDFLNKEGKLYGLVAPNMEKLGTIQNIEMLMKAAKANKVTLAVDPLVYTKVNRPGFSGGKNIS